MENIRTESKATKTERQEESVMFLHLKLRLKNKMQCNAIENGGNRTIETTEELNVPRFSILIAIKQELSNCA